jgi:NADPH:quinone reductase-like Zn-dependent oxidoreductase
MKAIVQDRYGAPEEVLRLQDVDRPPVGGRDVSFGCGRPA